MNERDHAIVVGISDYPQLGDGGEALSLRGPEYDADAVMEWLQSPTGGDMPFQNIALIKSSQFGTPPSPNEAAPTTIQLTSAVQKLIALSDRNRSEGRGPQVGRRLYIYMSGHGFSPGRRRGCLFAANAAESFGHNIDVTGWLDWFQDAGLFQEFVLWMDCCMNRLSFLQPGALPAPLTGSPTVPAATFVAFAAPRPLRAAEVEIPDGGNRYHGAFTWALLEGLRGAAADANGRITGRSLADWLRNAQAARLSPGDREDPDIAKEPDIIKEDPGLVFARGVPGVTYQVRIQLPDLSPDTPVRLWSGVPPSPQTLPAARQQVVSLAPGLYLVDILGAGFRQGFEVRGVGTVAIEETGPQVVMPAGGTVLKLDIQPSDPSAEIYVIDSRFALVDGNPGALSTPLVPGLFKIKTRVGRAIKERVILLDRDYHESDTNKLLNAPATVRAISGTASIHEHHIQVTKDATAEALHLAGGTRAALTVIARVWSGVDRQTPDARPWEGITIVDDKGQTVFDLAQEGTTVAGGDPLAYLTKEMKPGTYFLRQRLANSTQLEQSLTVVKNFALEVNILRRQTVEDKRLDQRPRISLRLRSLNGWPENDLEDRLIETARTALADERRIMNNQLWDLLMKKFQDPIAGIIGAHLLLIAAERDPHMDLTVLNEVVGNLRKLLGHDHPDVAALSLQCSNRKLRHNQPIASPPMFWRSWKMLIEGSSRRPYLISAALWDRVQAQSSLPPFLVWATNSEIQSAGREALDATAERYARVLLADPRQVRSSGSMQLWSDPDAFGTALAMIRPDRRLIGRLARKLRVPPVALDRQFDD